MSRKEYYPAARVGREMTGGSQTEDLAIGHVVVLTEHGDAAGGDADVDAAD